MELLIITLVLIFIGFFYVMTTRSSSQFDEMLESIKVEKEKESDNREKEQIIVKIEACIAKHIKTLALKRSQLVIVDDYGTEDVRKWRKEANYFLDKVVLPEMGGFTIENLPNIFEYIEQKISSYNKRNDDPKNNDNWLSDPYQYEVHCADLLKQQGWGVQTTKGSGDQGADVIAEKEGEKIVLQCKLYSSPVGNKAVQEVYAAKGFYEADRVIVVSNNVYTPSAKELASKLNVTLMHHNQLGSL